MVSYENLMYNLTYACKRKRCIYCSKKAKRGKQGSLDHRYPRDTGGISITDNLSPCCQKCNSKKSNLTHEQFLVWRNLPKAEAKKYLETVKEDREFILKTVGFILPAEWVEYEERDKVICDDTEQYVKGKRYYKIQEFYSKYQQFPRPAVVDKNIRILDGYNTILFARDNNIEYVPVVKLENVVRVTERGAV